MTSKEALDNCRYVAVLQIDWLCKKEFEIIQKDLEVLEIFKNNNYSVIHKDDDTYILSFNVNVNEIDDFREWWLENAKQRTIKKNR